MDEGVSWICRVMEMAHPFLKRGHQVRIFLEWGTAGVLEDIQDLCITRFARKIGVA